MPVKLGRGLALVACVSAGFVISAGPGVVARAAEPDRWIRAFTADASAAPTTEDAAQRRIAELAQRVRELEAQRPAQQPSGKSSELAAAVARNAELVARNQALAVENQELLQNRTLRASASASAAFEPASAADAKEQLRYWARQIQDGNPSFTLSPAWNGALNVILRRERELDTNNPWREP
jgi:hypothetical protein